MKSILIIDSGVIAHPKFEKLNICTTGFRKQNALNDIYDNVGHGTAVLSLISKGVDADKVQFYILRLFDDFSECTISNLIECLEFVAEHNVYDVINMSFGITASDESTQINQLKALCDKIRKQGTIIVAAYDNDGAISYPAYFSNVIGVDTSKKSNKRTEYEYVRNSCVNVLGYGRNQKVAWNNPLYTIIEGNSFACANVSSVIINMLIQGSSKESVEQNLEAQAICINDFEAFVVPPNRPKWLKGSKAITFPFNKEIHSLYAYEDMLDFIIVGAYDLKYKGLIGKDISDIISYKRIRKRILKSFDDIEWNSESFDMIIVGHIGELSAICKRNFMEEIIQNCIAFNKKLYAFDDLNKYYSQFQNRMYLNNNIYSPRIIYENVPKGRFGKLFNIQMPVLAVVGTSSSQGKFTIQLSLRKKFKELGYKVGQIGTEPSAFCFDMDFSYPYGYESSVYTSGYQNILLLNQVVHDIEMNDCDICLIGTQTNTALYGYSNLKNIPLFQAEILYGTMPDAFLLVVNVHDEIDYIVHTMRSTEELIESKCIGIVVYPMMQKQVIGTIYKKEQISDDEYKQFKERLTNRTNVPVCKFETALNTNALVNLVIDFFSVYET